jgi:hypothetical protein
MPRTIYPPQVTSVEIEWISLVTRADKDFYKSRRNEIEYEFTGRTFTADPLTRGAYGS